MKKWVLGSIIGGSVVGSLGIGAGVSLGVVLPKALKAADALKNFVANEGESKMAHWGNKKLNYIALGDSETAGFNGATRGRLSQENGKTKEGYNNFDYLSYADFLANDLRKANRLKNYHNYAVSGATIDDQKKLFTEHALAHETIKNADLISLTIGANDLLAFVKLLKIPFSLDLFSSIGRAAPSVVSGNAAREEVNPSEKEDGASYNQGQSPEETRRVFSESIELLETMIKTNDYSKILNIEEHVRKIIFKLLQRNIGLFVHDLHLAAPNAQILVLGHAFPFIQWPDQVLNTPRADWDGESIHSMYENLMHSMSDGVTTTVSGVNAYSNFIRLDYLHIKKSSVPSMDGANRIFDDYIKRPNADGTIPANHYVANAMPNAGDIHPSTFGHELMGNALFSILAPHLNLSTKDETSFYTFSKRYDSSAADKTWMCLDEDPSISWSTSEMVVSLLNGKSSVNKVINLLGESLRVLLDGEKTSNIVFKILSSITSSMGGSFAETLANIIEKIVPADPTEQAAFERDLNQAILEIDANTKYSAEAKSKAKALVKIVQSLSMKTPFSAIALRTILGFMNPESIQQYIDVENKHNTKSNLTTAELREFYTAFDATIGGVINRSFNPTTDKPKVEKAVRNFIEATFLLQNKPIPTLTVNQEVTRLMGILDQMIAKVSPNTPAGNADLGYSLLALSTTNAWSDFTSVLVKYAMPLMSMFN